MKYIVVCGDGMADYPIEERGNKTVLELSNIPNMNMIAKEGAMGELKTVPEGFEAGSDVANLSILGYDPKKYYTGRGPLEAYSIGVDLNEGDIAFRCNIITEENGLIKDYSSGHITTAESTELIKKISESFNVGKFYPGVSYRHLFVYNGENSFVCTPPHDVVGQKVSDNLIKGKNADILNKMMLESKKILMDHPVNKKRISEGKNPGNMIWFWGQGKKVYMEPFSEKFGMKGGVISAVDLIKGIGYGAKMDVINVPGATGFIDTNYEGKADYALKALEKNDFIYIHVEAPDEAGHAGNLEMKIKAIEDLDKRVVGRLLNKLDSSGYDYKIGIVADHPTPIKVKTHVSDPVPFAVYSDKIESDNSSKYTEKEAKKGRYGLIQGSEFIDLLKK
ncbi:MAG: 2,3-bisphosphoglycerate-independent phosphoglycerate mutase 1 [Candidatus Methanofastidiosum methylothiophilum]|jgi:2,3-bisphosphoglycerate-independent phosphoglycerate mutase|uniref:phosphoglycerate mutase (2,3-diphosphoglycerate-independent) n=1 Tax=Candidatus Methanofastidiosum methylothiophilum TaxID=1705564 RepID=A0A150IQT8_9EURY|nr:MAG: 2,3-bisphosphoglycerate-independent phosphoglycerate mutase 1 [Candidatus Methanofastidiosum methylthiophilus]NMC77521.1 cofactor-independent phosphoglycerate mutase [Candidatus Methanofastidiosa archaeon]